MLVHVKKIVHNAVRQGVCVGAFNVHNIESIKGVVLAAAEMKTPAIIQVSESSVRYIGLKSLVCLVEEMISEYAPRISFALHLDHGKDVSLIRECVKGGFSSVHIDASGYDLKKNIVLTKRVVKYAHERGVWVQGEVGVIKGGHGLKGGRIGDVPLANLGDVVRFVEATKIDTVAAAIGTAHGVFSDEKVDFGLLKEIKLNVKIPFVMHGGSGVLARDVKKAIKLGVNIINVGTDVKVAFCESVIRTALKNKKEGDPRVLLGLAADSVKKAVVGKMKLFGSCKFVTTQ